ncbi:MAG: hypothetical protein ACTHJ0_10695 [Flavipsychrobacter sp.]
MRKIFLPLVLLAFFALSFSACKQQSDYNAQPEAASNSFSATINGSTWNAKFAGAVSAFNKLDGSTVLLINGATPINDSVNETVVLQITNPSGINTYKLSDTGGNYGIFYYGKAGARTHRSKSGSVTFTSFSLTHVAGYYSMNTDSVNISDGSFNVDIMQ